MSRGGRTRCSEGFAGSVVLAFKRGRTELDLSLGLPAFLRARLAGNLRDAGESSCKAR